jgi:hypothetical protein
MLASRGSIVAFEASNHRVEGFNHRAMIALGCNRRIGGVNHRIEGGQSSQRDVSTRGIDD